MTLLVAIWGCVPRLSHPRSLLNLRCDGRCGWHTQFYEILVGDTATGRTWTTYHRFREFLELNETVGVRGRGPAVAVAVACCSSSTVFPHRTVLPSDIYAVLCGGGAWLDAGGAVGWAAQVT